MERRNWLWRSQVSEITSGETDSSQSLSSHSQRLCDDQAYATQITSSPEVKSNAASNEEVVTDVHTLTEKLSAALLEISAKEDLVKQNAKVAEDAVSGWEKAENEVLNLKQQLDAAKQKNAVLEDQVCHVNRELKDCMRQLRQAREEQEQKIHGAVANNSCNWESKRHELEWKVIKLEAQLQTAKEGASPPVNSDLLQRLEDVERENSSLKIELQSRLEELEFKTIERDENTTAQNRTGLSTRIDLMHDFLEMERLAALPDTDSVSSFFLLGTASDQPNVGQGIDTVNAEVEELVEKNAALENKLAKMEADILELETDLNECQKQLEESQSRVKEAELEIVELQTQLALANKSTEEVYEELKAAQANNENAESRLRAAQTEAEELISKSAENLAKCEKLEDDLLRMKQEAQLQQDTEILHRESVDNEFTFNQEKELALAASRFSECRKTIESLGLQLKSLATLEDFLLDSESTMELTSEITPPLGPQDDGEQMKLHNSDLSLPKRDSESSASLNPSISFGKSLYSFGRFYPTSKGLSRT
ncbi:filament-like plant protein 3 [Cicer arietinum]|uniref:filament-like plant protein 3 n=1 Tax=Cicer arietinum TaxID=3827 RepID=UPI00032A6522